MAEQQLDLERKLLAKIVPLIGSLPPSECYSVEGYEGDIRLHFRLKGDYHLVLSRYYPTTTGPSWEGSNSVEYCTGEVVYGMGLYSGKDKKEKEVYYSEVPDHWFNTLYPKIISYRKKKEKERYDLLQEEQAEEKRNSLEKFLEET
jgi:hypothetical protein